MLGVPGLSCQAHEQGVPVTVVVCTTALSPNLTQQLAIKYCSPSSFAPRWDLAGGFSLTVCGFEQSAAEGGSQTIHHGGWVGSRFWHSVICAKAHPSLPRFRADAGGSRLVLSGPPARCANDRGSLYYSAVTEPHSAACDKILLALIICIQVGPGGWFFSHRLS